MNSLPERPVPIPVPMLPDHVINVARAARYANVTERTIRKWVREDGIGRQAEPSGPVQISAVALELKINGLRDGLEALRRSEFDHADVKFCADRVGVMTKRRVLT